jgi:hypothetical protein
MRPHGYARYRLDGCRCYTCGWAVSVYERDRAAQIAAGTWRVPTGPVREHLRALRAAGMAGVGSGTVQDLLLRPRPTIRKPIADRLMALRPELAPSTHIPALGTVRRIRALAALGHSLVRQAAELGWDIRNLCALAGSVDGRVKVSTARLVAALYERWHMTPATARGSVTARNRARRLGWAPPMAWDDIDDPDEQPRGVRVEAGSVQ